MAATSSGAARKLPVRGSATPFGSEPSSEARVLAAVDLDVGVAEGVDRLELVADQEQPRVRAPERLDQRELQGVGVLELVDHQVAELLAVALAEPLVAAQQRHGLELEVLEVQRRALGLQLLVALAERGDQRPELLVGIAHHDAGDRTPRAVEGALVGRALLSLEELAAALELQRCQLLEEVERELGRRIELGGAREQLQVDEPEAARGLLARFEGDSGRVDQLGDPGGRIGRGRVGQARGRVALAAQLVVGAARHVEQGRAAVGGGQLKGFGVARADQAV